MNLKHQRNLFELVNLLSKEGRRYNRRELCRILSIDKRTLINYKNELLSDFHIEVIIDSKDYTYSISKETMLDSDLFGWMARGIESTVLSKADNKKFLLLDSSNDDKSNNVQFLPLLLESLHQSKGIKFKYQKFNSNENKEVELLPYYIKQYQQRWYIIGVKNDRLNEKNIRCYGLDRIVGLTLQDDSFKRKPEIEAEMIYLYENAIGIFSNGNIETVILSFSNKKAPYIKKVPLHHSQQLLPKKDNPNWTNFQYQLRINEDLIYRILYYGKEVKVIEPDILKTQIKQHLEDFLKNY
ncbi:WYL domain-containing protein [Flammeovirga sp. SubArs3]|uniref:helix-turn-helix transcriptional regulator n=1 Tax=Flammeovirga sp. SubArs3 TaxID=2995316 RepID=UPI00248B5B06|nr:WYL domain-containing protein [Flammeovirga sp. SubArs3]